MKSPLKWLGGKGKLLPQIKENFPNLQNIDKYVEPFIGGGSVFFSLLEENNLMFVINDLNETLMTLYRSFLFEDFYNVFIQHLNELTTEYYELDDKKEWFYRLRKMFNDSENTPSKAAKLLVLNKLCFNGIYRENKSGEFNAPYGYYKKPKFPSEEELNKIFNLFQEKNILCFNDDYKNLLDNVSFNENTLVYLDPPYLPINDTSNFTSYTKYKFGNLDILELKKFVDKLTEKGTNVMLSHQCENDDVKALLFDLFPYCKFQQVSTKHAVANKNQKDIKEFLIMNYAT